MSSPRGMYDMTGWEKIDCTESTEWWSDNRPLLRDYRYTGEDKPCEHYVASFDGSAARGDDE